MNIVEISGHDNLIQDEAAADIDENDQFSILGYVDSYS